MKNVKLYNVVFPIWIIYLLPPIFIIALIGNFLIDSAVIILCFYIFKLKDKGFSLNTIYGKSIFFVWIAGFVADIVGDIIILFFAQFGFTFNFPEDIGVALNTNVFDNFLAFLLVFAVMLIVGFLIFIINYFLVFRKLIKEKALRFKFTLTIAIITIPWTFLVPSEFFYRLFGY